jgi:hypothetical protein
MYGLENEVHSWQRAVVMVGLMTWIFFFPTGMLVVRTFRTLLSVEVTVILQSCLLIEYKGNKCRR